MSTETTPLLKGQCSTSGWTRAGQICQGLYQSRTLRALVITGIALAIIFTPGSLDFVCQLTTMNAPIAITGIGLIGAVGLFANFKCSDGGRKFTFEWSAINRLRRRIFGKNNYDTIYREDDRKDLLLGALPNALSHDLEDLYQKGVRTIICLNEDWELKPMGLSIPYTHEEYENAGIKFFRINVQDHVLVSIPDLENAAEAAHKGFKDPEAPFEVGSVLAQCRGGNGRSGMAIAAYLIRYHPELRNNNDGSSKTNQELFTHICKIIETERPSSTISNKGARILRYIELRRKLSDSNDKIPDEQLTAEDLPPPLPEPGKLRRMWFC